MKKYIYPLISLVLLALLSSCGATEKLVLSTMEPSPVTIASTITKIGIIKDERFEVVKILDSVPTAIQQIGADPNAIEWNSVQALCETNEVDAIFSLAYYEADTKVSIKKTKVAQLDMMREKKDIQGQELTLETLIENGWRIYDPKKQELVDEIVFNDQIISTGKGETATLAYRAIDDRRETMLERSKTNGASYGQRLLPSESSVSREYYVKGSSKLVAAGENAAAGNWESARAIWEQETGNSNAKIKSRAYHNLAVASEREEELDKALSLAKMAYETHDDEIYSQYMSTLQERIEKQPLLEKQLAKIDFAN